MMSDKLGFCASRGGAETRRKKTTKERMKNEFVPLWESGKF